MIAADWCTCGVLGRGYYRIKLLILYLLLLSCQSHRNAAVASVAVRHADRYDVGVWVWSWMFCENGVFRPLGRATHLVEDAPPIRWEPLAFRYKDRDPQWPDFGKVLVLIWLNWFQIYRYLFCLTISSHIRRINPFAFYHTQSILLSNIMDIRWY